jgi:hypothetical protein
MANRFAVANGNWSNTATWNGGTLPTVNDEVFSNTFTVTIDGTFTVISITNAAATGITAGGSFTFANGGDLTCTVVDGVRAGASTVLTFNLPSGQSATLKSNVVRALSNNVSVMTCTNKGTFNIVGNLTMTPGFSFGTLLSLGIAASGGTINHIGDITNTSGLSCISGPGNNLIYTYNHTGDIYGGFGNSNTIGASISLSGTSAANFNYNCTGNVFAGTSPALYLSSADINIIGNVTGTLDRAAINLIGGTFPTIVNVNGVITAGANQPAIVGIVTTLVKVQGTVINQGTYNAIYAGRITLETDIPYWQYKNALNTETRYLYPIGALNYPDELDVRDGIDYGGLLEFTGTAVIPSPANVLQGVPVDATVGTLIMTPADMWNYLTSSITTSGSIGKLVKDNLDAQVSTIKTKTDNLPSDPASNTEVNQVASEVINELNTSSVDVAVRLRNSATVETTGNQIADLS